MKRWLPITALMLGLAPDSFALDYNIVGKFENPNTAYINKATCADDDSLLLVNFSIASFGSGAWDTSQNPKVVFTFQKDANCAADTVELKKSKDGDIVYYIPYGTASFAFPTDVLDYTLGDLKTEVTTLSCTPTTPTEDDYYLCAKFSYKYVPYLGASEVTDNYKGGAKLRFDLKSPSTPELNAINPGDGILEVTWKEPTDTDLYGYYVLSAKTGDPQPTPPENPGKLIQKGTKSYKITGLENGTEYQVWVIAYDASMNTSVPQATPLTGKPQVTDDFWEYYQKNGGNEQGGFCFVATAAWGGYDDPMVKTLRGFRDNVLATSSAGQGFIDTYYRHGPRWARAIRGSETYRGVARWSLLPLVGAASLAEVGALEWLLLASGLVLAGFLMVRARRRLGEVLRRFARPAGTALVLVIGLGAAQARAQGVEARGEVITGKVPDFQFQLRLGPYMPSIDGPAFQRIFFGKSELLSEIGLDWEVFRGFGTATVGGSAGFVQYVGRSRFTDGSVATADTTVLNLVPMKLTIGYHATQLEEYWRIPIVPYVQGGLCYYFWWATNNSGGIASFENANGETIDAQGGIFGLHFGTGVKLLLDALDRAAAANLENDIGIVNSYFFAEYAYSWVNGFDSGDHWNLGDATFMFGLMMEF